MKSSNKKILHVVNISFVLPYYIGEQFDYFQKKGYNFYVACSDDDFLKEYSKKVGFEVLGTPIKREIDLISDIRSLFRIVKLIRRENIQMVFGHTPKGALLGMIGSFLCGSRSRIYFRHGLMYETSRGFKRIMFKFFEKITSMCATKIVCVSNSVCELSIKEGLNKPEKSIILNKGTCNGVNLKRFQANSVLRDEISNLKSKYNILEVDLVVGYVGRLVIDKGIQELILAWKMIIHNMPNVKLLLVGPFEERDALDIEVREYIMNEQSIIHTGLVSNVIPYFSLMDVFILPSYREGFPTVVLEASAMELPVITTRSTGCIDSIIEDQTGIYTEITADSIRENLLSLLNDEKLRNTLGRNGRLFVENFYRQESIWDAIDNNLINNS